MYSPLEIRSVYTDGILPSVYTDRISDGVSPSVITTDGIFPSVIPLVFSGFLVVTIYSYNTEKRNNNLCGYRL